MKFRALMQDPLYIREFQNIVGTLAKLAKDCVMILTENHMHFIVNEEHSSTTSPLVWVSMAANDYFPQYKITSARPEDDCIVLAMSATHLNRSVGALRAGSAAGAVHWCKFKLQRIQFPCLSVTLSQQSQQSAEPREVTHDVPVAIIPACDWAAYMVPPVPKTHLVLGLPSLRLLRSLIDKLKNISPSLVFYGSSNGELNLVAESEMATITSKFCHLLLLGMGKERQALGAPDEVVEASCLVDSRKASSFFNALQLPNEELSIGIDNDHSIHLQMNVREDVVIHSVMPAVCV